MEIRSATVADVDAIVAVLHVNDEMHLDDRYVCHLLASGRVVVAAIDDQVVGVGATIERAGNTHIADLYVDPSRHGTGIGARLLAALEVTRERCTTFSSTDARALPLYVRAGLVPWWPLLYFHGRPSRQLATPFRLENASARDVAAIDGKVLGGEGGAMRTGDHEYYAGRPGASSFVVRDGGRAVAAGHWLAGTLDMLSVLDPADALGAVSSVASGLAQSVPGAIGIALPGPHPALRALLDAGLPITGRDLYCTTAFGLVDPVRRLPNPGLC